MGNHFRGPLQASRQAFGGAGENLNIGAIAGESDLATTFDDFDYYAGERDLLDASSGGIEDLGWVLTQVGTPHASSAISINDDGEVGWTSSLHIDGGSTADTGVNAQLNPTSGESNQPFIWIPADGTPTVLDSTSVVFACRIGVSTDEAAGDFDGKAFIGWARQGETAIMTPGTGAISVAGATDFLVGFHLGGNLETGTLDGISQGRLGTTPYAEGTNFTQIGGAGYLDSTLANGAATIGDTMWFDLALRCQITDMSDDDDNGTVTFYHRRVLPHQGALGSGGNVPVGDSSAPWTTHGTVLQNATPNPNGVIMVPTIEAINGPTDRSQFLLDWWAMGMSRPSRRAQDYGT